MVSPELLKEWRLSSRKGMNLSFAGCGFLGIYHVGVCSCFRRYGSHLSTEKISGASAGAIAACALLTGVGLGESTNYVLDVALKARSRAFGPLHPNFDIVHHLKEGLRRFLPEDAHKICSGRLHISLTRLSDRKNVLISQFDSREELIQALNCSAFVPFWSGVLPPTYKGVRYVDGGLSNNIPILDEYTVTVSPFAGESDICPNDFSSSYLHVFLANTSIEVNSYNLYRMSHALFPPNPEQLSQMCQQGFDDALKFLQKNELISCARHLWIESAITPIDYTQNQYCDNPHDEPVTGEHDHDKMVIDDQNDSAICDDNGEDFDSDDDNFDSCEECLRYQAKALRGRLPHPVVSALQAGIDSVNHGLLAPIYKYQAYKLLSLMTASWLLPLDLTLVLTKKFFDWAPYLPSDMRWFTQEFIILVQKLYNSLQHGRHKYSARFTCQLAITEMENSCPAAPTHMRSRHNSRADKTHRNLNVGFSVDFHTHKRSPLSCMDDLRHHILENDIHSHGRVTRSGEEPSSFHVMPIDFDGSVAYDTFDNCLRITEQMEAILAYHYSEENDPDTIKVTEIFALDEPSTSHSQPSTSRAYTSHSNAFQDSFNTSDLAWDNFIETKSERSSDLRRCATNLFMHSTPGGNYGYH